LQTLGYLSNLRGLPEVRGGTALPRAYRFVKELHKDGQTPFYITTIFDGNTYAQQILTSGRAGLPVYKPYGKLHTLLIPLYRRIKIQTYSNLDDVWVKPANSETEVAKAVDWMNQQRSQRQFGHSYSAEDFLNSNLLPDFSFRNLLVARLGSSIVGTLGIWNQTGFKQSVVTGYCWQYRILQKLFPSILPAVGKPMPYVYGSFLNTTSIRALPALLTHALNEWSNKGYSYLLLGLHERDTESLAFASQYAAIDLTSTLYVVYWPDLLPSGTVLPSEELIPQIEIATL